MGILPKEMKVSVSAPLIRHLVIARIRARYHWDRHLDDVDIVHPNRESFNLMFSRRGEA
jgi:hypothetical protein